jgi:hypothetical protein
MQCTAPGTGTVRHVHHCAGDVLLTPEVMSDIGSRCEVAAAPDGHALLLSMPGPVSGAASIDTAAARHGREATDVKTAKQKACHELMALPAQLQLQAVQVIVCLDWHRLPAANDWSRNALCHTWSPALMNMTVSEHELNPLQMLDLECVWASGHADACHGESAAAH